MATIKIIDCTTGTETLRDMNDSELAQLKIDADAAKAQAQASAYKTSARQAVLDRLGITADEAALLLG
jgi:hypothetical protein